MVGFEWLERRGGDDAPEEGGCLCFFFLESNDPGPGESEGSLVRFEEDESVPVPRSQRGKRFILFF